MNIRIFQRNPSAAHLTRLKKSDIRHHWRKRAVPVLALTLLTSISLPAIAANLNLYEISDGTKTESVYLLEENNADAAVAQSSFDLADYAMVSVLETDEDHYDVTVKHKYDVTVTADGKSQTVYTGDATVASLLAQAGITLGEDDKVTPSLGTTITSPSEIKVVRVTKKTIKKTKKIKYKTVTKETSKWYEGTSKVTRKGQNGTKELTIEVTYEDGKEVSRETVDTKVIAKPVNKVITKGTKERETAVAASGTTASGVSLNGKKAMTMTATAYSGGGTTASGMAAGVGRIAVDPRVIPLGTKLYVSGYGYCVAADTGGAIKGNIIDVYFNSEAQCYNWGRRSVTVYILS